MEMRECKLFLGNLSICEQLSGREKPGKLECSKNIKNSCVFKDFRVLLLTEGSFSSKTRTSLKMHLLFYVSEHSNFPAFSLLESCSQTDKCPKNSLHSCTSIICEYAHNAYCFPSRRPIFVVRPSKAYFSGCQFQNRTHNKFLETRKSFKVDFSL